MRSVAVLVHTGPRPAASALAIAAATAADAAGARVIDLPGYDPRAEQAVIRALAAARPQRVIGIGAGFGSASPAGGQGGCCGDRRAAARWRAGPVPRAPDRRPLREPGHPGARRPRPAGPDREHRPGKVSGRAVHGPDQGAGDSGLRDHRDRRAGIARPVAARTPTSPASPPCGRGCNAATRAGLYVTLDLQPGRASLLAQAKKYRSLLKLPNVGLALDPEWAAPAGPGAAPPDRQRQHQPRSTAVASWLARLTAQYRLPQKLLELHEFRLTMIQNVAAARHPPRQPGDRHQHGRPGCAEQPSSRPGRQSLRTRPRGCSSAGRTSTPRTPRCSAR